MVVGDISGENSVTVKVHTIDTIDRVVVWDISVEILNTILIDTIDTIDRGCGEYFWGNLELLSKLTQLTEFTGGGGG